MTSNFDTSKLSQAASRKATPHDNCIVLDLGTGSFPRDIEVRLPDDDGARQIAIWDGSLDLAINDEVFCNEYAGNPKWRIAGMGGADSGAGKQRVSKIWESDFGAVAMETDANGNVTINGARTLTIPTDLIHAGDPDNKISFTDDVQTFTVGGEVLLALTEAGQDVVKIGDGGDVDINFNDDGFFQGSSGFLGIGDSFTSPDVPLHLVRNGTIGKSWSPFSSTVMLIEQGNENVNAGITFATKSTGTKGILAFNFGDESTENLGTMQYDVQTNELGLGTNNVPNRLLIDSAGLIGINGVTSPSTELDIGAGAIEFDEMTAPAAGAANTVRLFARDDGGGDTELCVRFSSGLIQVIAPLEFGEISRTENATLTALTVSTPAQYLFFDTNGPANGATPDHTNDHITVGKTGTYLIIVSISAESVAGSAYDVQFTVEKNNGATLVGELHAHRSFAGGGGDFGSVSLSGLAVLTAGDTIELWVENQTSNQDLRIEDATLSITMVGVNA